MKRVLLVEDNADNADLIRDLLADRYELTVHTDAHSTLATLEDPAQPPPDLFLLDISLPGMDGIELLRQIRAQARLRSIPAIALTAHAMKTDRDRLTSAGFNAYLSKPIVEESLLTEAIEDQLSNPLTGEPTL